MNSNMLLSIPGLEPDEMSFIQEAIRPLNEDQQKSFFLLYQSRRKDPQVIMICTILGFAVIAGVQRFVLGQIGMGILYLLTGGLCLVGTIIDLINYKKLTLEYNQLIIVDCKKMASGFN